MKESALKIIVVDDSDFSREEIVKILREENYNIVGEASSAEEAVKLSGGEANLYIIDVVMPKVSGIELAKLLTDKNAQLNIIMMSSLKTESIVIESISSGALDFLQKPFTREELLWSVQKIEKIISEER